MAVHMLRIVLVNPAWSHASLIQLLDKFLPPFVQVQYDEVGIPYILQVLLAEYVSQALAALHVTPAILRLELADLKVNDLLFSEESIMCCSGSSLKRSVTR